MLTAASGTGAAKRPVHKAVTHAGRPVVHHATLTAAYKGSAPRKAAPKKRRTSEPKFPTLGKLPKPKTRLAVPLPSSAPWKPPQGRVTIPHAPAGPVSPYVNPLRAVQGLVPERIDQGVDYAGHGPIFALGPGKITNVGIGQGTGWAGPPEAGVNPGGYVAEQLSSGPGKGHVVYVAEGIYPTVHTGQTVTSKTVIANMVAPIETGYASGSGTQTLAATSGELGGPTSTGYGSAYSRLLQRLGAPAGVPQDPGAATRYQSVPSSYSVTGGNVPTPSKGHISLPPAVPPTSGVHGVNPPSTRPMVPMGPVELTAHVTPIRRKGGPIPKFRKPVPTVISVPPVLKPKKKPPAPTPSPSVTTITSSKGTGSALGTGQAAPTSGGMSGGGTLLIVAGVGIVLLLVFMNKKGKKGKGSRPRR